MAVTSDTAIELPSEFEELIEHLRDSANARAVFGEPVEREGRTVIPVAKIGMGFGGGFGPVTEDTAAADGEGGSGVGGGGGAMARPVGALEITDHDTRFVPLSTTRDRLVVVAGFGLGLLIGRLLGRRGPSSADQD